MFQSHDAADVERKKLNPTIFGASENSPVRYRSGEFDRSSDLIRCVQSFGSDVACVAWSGVANAATHP